MPPRFGAASILTAIADAVGGANRGESSMTRLERSMSGRALAGRAEGAPTSHATQSQPTRSAAMSTAPAPPITLDALISELELERYREAFATAGVGDAELDAARAAGSEAVEALIQKVGLRGGSATKLRRRLLARADAGGSAVAAAPPPRERKVRRERADAPEPSEAAIPVKDRIVIVRTQADLDRLFRESSVVVVEFRARWCGGCNKFAPTYTRMAPDVPAACLTMCDVDDSPDLAEKFGATQLPLFVILRDGVKCDALVGGKATALRQKVQQAIDSPR
jgi:thioredoxin 1